LSKRKRPPTAHKVGRGSPPVETRFKPGQSGNPKGRPRKERAAGKLDPLLQKFRDALIEEGDRPITINEGGEQRTIPASQAVVRATFISAVKGNSQAQRTILQMTLEIERRNQKEHAELFGSALELKHTLEIRLQQWLASGRTEEEFPLHPDDIEIDPQTLDVRNYYQIGPQQREARTQLIRARDELLEWIARATATLAEEEEDVGGLVQDGLDFALEQLPQLNDALPPRLRRHSLDPVGEARPGKLGGPK
jgi:hypothetical protein